MKREEWISYAVELNQLIAENELKLNEVNMERVSHIAASGGTEEARHTAWEAYWPKMKPYQEKIKSLKEELQHATFMSLEKKYMAQCLHSDANPYEVIEERTDKLWMVRRMKAEETEESKHRRSSSFVSGGFLGHFDNSVQDWKIEPDPDGDVVAIRLHVDGRWYDAYGLRYVPQMKPYKFYDFNF